MSYPGTSYTFGDTARREDIDTLVEMCNDLGGDLVEGSHAMEPETKLPHKCEVGDVTVEIPMTRNPEHSVVVRDDRSPMGGEIGIDSQNHGTITALTQSEDSELKNEGLVIQEETGYFEMDL